MAERSAGWYDDEADATWLRYWDGRSWTPHTTSRAEAGLLPAVACETVAVHTDSLPHSITRTVRLLPEHTTVPTPRGEPAASGSVFATQPPRPGEGLSAGRVAILVVAALLAGSLVVTLASSVAVLLLF